MNEKTKYILPSLRLTYADILSRPLFYADDQFSESILKLMMRKSFTKKNVEQLKNMGFTVDIKRREIVLPNMEEE